MVLTEVLQNAMEHGFAEGSSGLVEVSVSPAGEEHAVVRVLDDGIGLPDGFDAEASGTLGLSIVRTLVAELGGSLTIAPRSDSAGTVVEFSFRR
jgi:two-component sensor histidine kinase